MVVLTGTVAGVGSKIRNSKFEIYECNALLSTASAASRTTSDRVG